MTNTTKRTILASGPVRANMRQRNQFCISRIASNRQSHINAICGTGTNRSANICTNWLLQLLPIVHCAPGLVAHCASHTCTRSAWLDCHTRLVNIRLGSQLTCAIRTCGHHLTWIAFAGRVESHQVVLIPSATTQIFVHERSRVG